jgi:hypothetical protein
MIHIHAIKTLGRNDEPAELRALPAPKTAGQMFDSIIRLYNDEDHIIGLEQATNQVLGLNADKESKVFYWYKVDLESDFQYSAFIAVKSLNSADHEWAKQEARHRRWTAVGACTQ